MDPEECFFKGSSFKDPAFRLAEGPTFLLFLLLIRNLTQQFKMETKWDRISYQKNPLPAMDHQIHPFSFFFIQLPLTNLNFLASLTHPH